MPDQPPADRAIPLACSVRSLRRYCLEVRCGSRVVHIPLRLMAASGAAGLTMAEVLLRLRCERCGERPGSVALEEDAAAGTPGRMGASGWRVVLIELANLSYCPVACSVGRRFLVEIICA
jgi:hypothetical protein